MIVFVAVAEAGSLTAAGSRLGLPKSTVSRRLQSYEEQLGVTLFRRSTRSISLTDPGKRHFDRVSALVHEASEAISELAEHTQQPAGLIRISASRGIGENLLAPKVWQFLDEHPKVRIELVLTDDLVDLVGEGIDFTVRMGELEDSELIAKPLGKTRRILVASPKLMRQYPMPRKPDDLRSIPAIVTTPAQDFWRFANGDGVRVNWRIAAGGFRAAMGACLFGHGASSLPEKLAQPHIKTGRLVRLLEDFPLPEVSITLVYPKTKHQSAAARAFRSTISELERTGYT